jgi:hypothetical protein
VASLPATVQGISKHIPATLIIGVATLRPIIALGSGGGRKNGRGWWRQGRFRVPPSVVWRRGPFRKKLTMTHPTFQGMHQRQRHKCGTIEFITKRKYNGIGGK